jgi:hypothetical protein
MNSSFDARISYMATQSNREAILAVLRRVLPPSGLVLEVASGTGEHAAYFAAQLPGIAWQPSDPDSGLRASIAAWRDVDVPTNLAAPLDLDVRDDPWPIAAADAIVCINLIHIAPWAACLGVLSGAGRLLAPGRALYFYGAFRVDGRHTASSNEAFDRGLRSHDPEWGVRDLESVTAEAAIHGLVLAETVDMPRDNLSVIFRKV